MDHHERRDHNPAIAGLLEDAYVVPVDVETAARHLWVIHSVANSDGAQSQSAAAVDAALSETAEARQAVLAMRGSIAEEASLASLRGTRRLPRSAALVMTLVFLMSFSGVAVAASQASLPGDVLYPVKRGTERAQLIFTRDPFTRAELQLSFARARLDELNLIAESQPDRAVALVVEIAGTLVEVETSPPEVAAQVQPVSDGIRHDTSESIAQLHLPADAREAVVIAMTPPPATAAPTATVQAAGPTGESATMSATPMPSRDPALAEGQTATGTPPPVAVAVAPSGTETNGDATETTGSAAATSGQTPRPAGEEASGAPTSPSHGPTVQPLPAGGASTNPSPATEPTQGPTPTVSPSTGPIVTARPQPTEGSEDGGSSRTEDSSETSSPAPSEPPGPDVDAAAPTEAEAPAEEPQLEPVQQDLATPEPAPSNLPGFPEGAISRPTTDF